MSSPSKNRAASGIEANLGWPQTQRPQMPRPRMPHRTLSSSLRLYSSPLIPRQSKDLGSSAQNRGLPTTYEANESDPLLAQSPVSLKPSYTAGSVGTGLDDGDDDADIEADQLDEQADSDGLYPPNCCWTTDGNQPAIRTDPFGNRNCDVYGNIHRVRRDILDRIDDPYSLDQLKAPRMNISVVRPLVDKYYNLQDLSIIYCLLVNRSQFIREQSYVTHHQTVNLTRAPLCEVLAEKVLRRYNELNPGPRGLLKIATILVYAFEPFQGASDEVLEGDSHANERLHRQAAGYYHHKLTALEVAIVSESKSFLASTACQKVVDAIYRGKVVYSPSSFIDIMPDRYKRRPISLYDPRRAPILNQYRLIVPRTRNIVEVVQFAILLVLYICVMVARQSRDTVHLGPVEIFFDVFALGWILDQIASCLEHGWHVYTQNLWSFLDVIFAAFFLAYFGLRMHSLVIADPIEAHEWSVRALDLLSCAAPVMVPRLAFNVMSENMLFLSLRAMMADFVTLTILAFWCFAGFLLALKWLHNDLHPVTTITKWMIFVWFGLDGTGINEAPTFHPIIGPILFVAFAFLGNTLFLTILVSMLSNTFSLISSNAIQEIQYRRAVLTFLGVKSDALFAFMPPFNIMALFILAPLKWILTPRMFHTVNVFMVRMINFPFLMLLSWYERKSLWAPSKSQSVRGQRIDWKNRAGPRIVAATWWSSTIRTWISSKFSAHGDIQAVFDTDPPDHVFFADEGDANGDFVGLSKRDFNDLEPLGSAARRYRRRRNEQNSFDLDMPFRNSPQPTAGATTDEDNSSPTSTRKSKSKRLSLSIFKPKVKSNVQSPEIPSSPRGTKRPNLRRAKSSTAAQDGVFYSEDEEPSRKSQRRRSQMDTLNRTLKRNRKDSLVDYEETGYGAVEANARLGKLEQRLMRIEELLIKAITTDEMMGDLSGAAGPGSLLSGSGSDVDAEEAVTKIFEAAQI